MPRRPIDPPSTAQTSSLELLPRVRVHHFDFATLKCEKKNVLIKSAGRTTPKYAILILERTVTIAYCCPKFAVRTTPFLVRSNIFSLLSSPSPHVSSSCSSWYHYPLIRRHCSHTVFVKFFFNSNFELYVKHISLNQNLKIESRKKLNSISTSTALNIFSSNIDFWFDIPPFVCCHSEDNESIYLF